MADQPPWADLFVHLLSLFVIGGLIGWWSAGRRDRQERADWRRYGKGPHGD
jgi:hypothetical protein